jgi:DNA-binding response OmpR family regulator
MSASIHILAVEDTLVHSRIIERCLNDDYDLTVVKTAEEARDRLDAEQFDLLLVDWGLPGESGLSLIKDLRNGADNNRLPIVMLTAEDRVEHVTEALDAGVNDYVVKPTGCDVLRRKIDGLA